MISYGRQDITDEDVEAVVRCLRSDFLTQGPAVEEFEKALVRTSLGVSGNQDLNAVAVSSATAALHLAVISLGAKPGSLVWTVPNTFVASANCALYCGAEIDFVDIDRQSMNMSVSALREKLGQAEKNGRFPQIVIPVHFAGFPADLSEIRELSQKYKFKILEDASHALGAEYLGQPIGNCQWSEMAVFSFHPVKMITTGEGGAVMVRDQEMLTQLRRLRSHGITRDLNSMELKNSPAWHYEQCELGYNYRLTDIAATLGTSQMKRLDSFVSKRESLAKRYDELLSDLPVETPLRLSDRKSSWHLYVVRLKNAGAQQSRIHRNLIEGLRNRGVGALVHYPAVHLQPFYRNKGFKKGMFPTAEAHAETAVTLPLHPGLTESQQQQIVMALREELRASNL